MMPSHFNLAGALRGNMRLLYTALIILLAIAFYCMLKDPYYYGMNDFVPVHKAGTINDINNP